MEDKIKKIIRGKERSMGETDFVWNHTQRVRKLCKVLANKEGVEDRLLDTAAILHDISKIDCLGKEDRHAHVGADISKEFLTEFDDTDKKKILNIIRKHSDKGSGGTIEEQILQDADYLDKFGAVGIGTFFIKAGLFGKTHQDFLKKDFSEGLQKLNTKSAKEMFEQRVKFMRVFSERLESELEGLE